MGGLSVPTHPPIDPDFGAKAFAERNRWFSVFGMVVGAGLVLGGMAMGVSAARDLVSAPSQPVACAAEVCPDAQWVEVTDAELTCDAVIRVPGPYVYAPVTPAASAGLVAAVDLDDGPCTDAAVQPIRGVIKPVSSRSPLADLPNPPQRILWLGHGPGNSAMVLGIGIAFILLGVFCIRFYRARLGTPH
jgi:hypothetical protein